MQAKILSFYRSQDESQSVLAGNLVRVGHSHVIFYPYMDSPNKREWGKENDITAPSFNQAKDGLLWVAVLDGQGGAELRKGGWTNNNCLGPPGVSKRL